MVQTLWSSVIGGILGGPTQPSGIGLTDTGKLRTHNEDAIFVSDALGLYLVADGMGGHAQGEIASSLAIETISKGFSPSNGNKIVPLLIKIIQEANQRIYDQPQKIRPQEGVSTLNKRMGTTLVALAISKHNAVIAHAGDSRAYRLRHSKLERLTRDHSLSESIQEGVNAPVRIHPNLKNIVTRALGIDPELEVDIREEKLKKDDLFLLCSDGLTNMVPDSEIKALLSFPHSDALACKALIEKANSYGGKDNISCILIRCG